MGEEKIMLVPCVDMGYAPAVRKDFHGCLEAGDLQKADADLGCVFNMGGSGVANYCSVLERRNP